MRETFKYLVFLNVSKIANFHTNSLFSNTGVSRICWHNGEYSLIATSSFLMNLKHIMDQFEINIYHQNTSDNAIIKTSY